MNPHQITKDFEKALCEYTGAPYAVAVNSCTMALLLAVAWQLKNTPMTATEVEARWFDRGWRPQIEIPKRTYISVPMSIIHAGGRPTFRDEEWKGFYQLKPLPIWDSARWFTSALYYKIGTIRQNDAMPMICVSFHASKTLGLEQGGAILHDNQEADAWLRRARFDGRIESLTPEAQAELGFFDIIGWHCYMNPSTAAQGILRLHSLPRHNDPLPNDEYPDLSTMEIFR